MIYIWRSGDGVLYCAPADSVEEAREKLLGRYTTPCGELKALIMGRPTITSNSAFAILNQHDVAGLI